jgi:hypothetical protein
MKSHAPRMSRYLSCSAWVAGLMLLTHVSGFACKCFPPESTQKALEQSDAVFSGTVTEIAPFLVEDSFLMNRVTFRVIETWKGTNTATKIVLAGMGGGDCGYPFVLGSDYLVFANGSNTFATSICTLNSLLSAAAGALQDLGEGQKPDRPLLNIAYHQGTITFTWLTNWTDFHLETTDTLQPPSPWRTLSDDVHTVGQYYVVTNDVTSSRAFFCLAR